ncbi:alpha/beta hydrolase [Nocardiopsis rhodophaea]
MDTTRIVYERGGSGTPVVLLHGLGHRRQAWYPVMADLRERHEVIALDLPGFGDSPAPDVERAYDVPSLVDTVRRFCDDLGLDRPHLVGNSLGGAVALELGAAGAASSVTALSPIGFNPPPAGAGARLLAGAAQVAAFVPPSVLRAATHSPAGRALARRALRGDPSDPADRHLAFDASAITAGSPYVRLAPHVAAYTFTASVVPCPVTIAWGDRDRLLPPSGARRALRRIPHARQVTLLGCGHIPMSDHPRAVAAEILRTADIARDRGRRAVA